MTIRVKLSALRQTRWYEYVLRFALGGVATALTGLIAKVYGPETGGLFLAFPSIFVASATLIEMHEKKRKEKAGLPGTRRGVRAAALDAAGAVLGSVALLVFAALVWLLSRRLAGSVLIVAMAAWCAVSVLLWRFRHVLRGSF
ncbi:MAG TPA: DUF3147 family protein [Rhizomicrobium sp.]|nr:DUF3147 family protein [Rhizomicrobium sp.]